MNILLFYLLEFFFECNDCVIAFNAGTHTNLIRIAFYDFEQLVNPKVVKVARY